MNRNANSCFVFSQIHSATAKTRLLLIANEDIEPPGVRDHNTPIATITAKQIA